MRTMGRRISPFSLQALQRSREERPRLQVGVPGPPKENASFYTWFGKRKRCEYFSPWTFSPELHLSPPAEFSILSTFVSSGMDDEDPRRHRKVLLWRRRRVRIKHEEPGLLLELLVELEIWESVESSRRTPSRACLLLGWRMATQSCQNELTRPSSLTSAEIYCIIGLAWWKSIWISQP